ncbi:MAG: class I SAM-dependent rRNA methyltransferase [Planctomycetota bacterium]|nr:class I SAM-dependent rRNA methyltransferase [Planctomycetota bacterium]
MTATRTRTVTLKPGRAKAVWRGHPWVFADSVAEVSGSDGDSDWVRVVDADERVVGHGFLSPHSAIRVRLLVRGEDEVDPNTLLEQRIARAVALRRRLFPAGGETNAYRLVHSEGDDLPGLVVDRLGDDVLVAQFAIAATHARRDELARTLLASTGCATLVARPGGYERAEGIPPDDEPFVVGDPPAEQVVVREAGIELEAAPLLGQKTGHYADQRENRLLVGRVAAGLDVLDLYAGTGGFALQCAVHGAAHVRAVETSERSVGAARRNAERNGVADRVEVEQGDVGAALAALRDERRRFDLVIADPPNFFPRSGSTRHGMKAHRELNVRAMSRVEVGGFLATFSCSAQLEPVGFVEMLRSAARECRRSIRVLRELGAGPDHPVAGSLPTSRYLTGFLLQID